MINRDHFLELLNSVSYYNAAEGDTYFRESAQRQRARQVLREYANQFPVEQVLTVYQQLLREGNSFLVWEGDLT